MGKVIYPIGGYAPGFYSGTCKECKEIFMGDKRSTECEPCAINILNRKYTKAHFELSVLKSTFSRLKKAFETINF